MKVVPLRLEPGDDLRGALETWMGELVIGLLLEWRFCRQFDPTTGYTELRIMRKGPWLPN